MKWSSQLDEATVLEDAKTFIADELNLDHVSIVVAETDADDTGRAHSAMPLSPAVVYGWITLRCLQELWVLISRGWPEEAGVRLSPIA